MLVFIIAGFLQTDKNKNLRHIVTTVLLCFRFVEIAMLRNLRRYSKIIAVTIYATGSVTNRKIIIWVKWNQFSRIVSDELFMRIAIEKN